MRYSLEQRQFIVDNYHKNDSDWNAMIRLFRAHYGIPAPKKESMVAILEKWRRYKTIENRHKNIRPEEDSCGS